MYKRQHIKGIISIKSYRQFVDLFYKNKEPKKLLRYLYDNIDQDSIEIDTINHESGSAQMEINFQHGDPLELADQVFLFKRTLRQTALKHKLYATFMAKPFLESAGSGMHIHVSLKDGNGNPVFAHDKSDSTGFNENLQYAVGGLAETIKERTAIFCPNANSYRRFAPGFFAPITPNWGPNHRNLSLRIPLSDDDNVRIEHRSAGADANPYLVCLLYTSPSPRD